MSSRPICEDVYVREGTAADLTRVAEIQANSPEAAHWPAADYLQNRFLVAEVKKQIAGFIVWRGVGPGESELLNLAVAAEFRRIGIGRQLMESLLRECEGAIFLEVRESNAGARKFYQAFDFHEVGVRSNYYEYPAEQAIVMKFHSC